MKSENQTPFWMRALCYLCVFCTFAGFIGSAIVAVLTKTPGQTTPPILSQRLVYIALISLGIAFEMGIIFTAKKGSYYSGLARRNVTRSRDPIHFWLLLGVIAILPLALIAFAVFKLYTISA